MDQPRFIAAPPSPSRETSTRSSNTELASTSAASATGTSATTSSGFCPVCAAQGTQSKCASASSSALLSIEPAWHQRLHIPPGTFRLCGVYRRTGKCNNPQCRFLHVWQAWLAGYASFQNSVSSSNFNTVLLRSTNKISKEKTERNFNLSGTLKFSQ